MAAITALGGMMLTVCRGLPGFFMVQLFTVVSTMWDDLLRALCLMLVFEGLLPAIAPQRWRASVLALCQTDTRIIRNIGIGCMLAGAGMLYLIH